jgi:hypothetical protein
MHEIRKFAKIINYQQKYHTKSASSNKHGCSNHNKEDAINVTKAADRKSILMQIIARAKGVSIFH